MFRIALICGALLVPSIALAGGGHQTPQQRTYNEGGAGGSGGQGGAAAAAASSAAASRATAANRNANTAAVTGNALGSTNNIDARTAPSVYLPGIGGGGMDCPVVGFGVGGSGIGGGGGIGPTWISSDCNTRKLADQLDRMGYRDAAVALLADQFPEVKRALDTAPVQPVKYDPPRTYCDPRPGWTKTQLQQRYPECR